MADNALLLQIKAISQTELWYANLVYIPADLTPSAIDPIEATEGWVTDNMTALRNCLCDTTQVLSVTGTLRGTPNAGLSHQVVVSQYGTIDGEELPVWVTASIKKYPDNTTVTHPEHGEFRAGRIALSGVPEAAQNGGALQSTYAVAVGTFCSNIMVLEQTLNPSLGLAMGRGFGNAALVNTVLVSSCALNRIGSQLTRKH